MENKIFISGEVMSSKNAKRIVYNKFTKRTMILNSVQVERYKKSTYAQWIAHRKQFHKLIENQKKPYFVKFRFIRETKRIFDFVNLLQLPLDLMVYHEWIEDDNYLNVVPVIDSEVVIDKHNAGLEIEIIKSGENL